MLIELPDSQLERLSVLCRREKISRAEAIRRAVDKLLDEQKPMENAMAGAFGIWKDRAGQVRELREQLRGEWR
jgi:metal-responsive CopG/Arc/MetJ family transcriptional regulator